MAFQDPLFDFRVSDIDTASDPKYYGYLNRRGEWYVMREAADGTFRYAYGRTGYAAAWTDKANLSYDLFSTILPP